MYFKMCFMYRFLLGITDFPHNRHFYLKVKKNFQKKSCLFRVFFFFFLIKSLNNTRSIAKLPLFTVQHRFYIYIGCILYTPSFLHEPLGSNQLLDNIKIWEILLQYTLVAPCSTVGVYHLSQWQMLQENRQSQEIYSPYLGIC